MAQRAPCPIVSVPARALAWVAHRPGPLSNRDLAASAAPPWRSAGLAADQALLGGLPPPAPVPRRRLQDHRAPRLRDAQDNTPAAACHAQRRYVMNRKTYPRVPNLCVALLPLPACGERAGVRGSHTLRHAGLQLALGSGPEGAGHPLPVRLAQGGTLDWMAGSGPGHDVTIGWRKEPCVPVANSLVPAPPRHLPLRRRKCRRRERGGRAARHHLAPSSQPARRTQQRGQVIVARRVGVALPWAANP